MKTSEAFKGIVEYLSANGIDNPSFEADCLFEKAFGIGKTERLTHSESQVEFDEVFSLAEKRAKGIPLQYLIGSWDFYGFTFSVGEGVLIPRPETEELVDKALNLIGNVENPVVFDLCSGSGCIGLSIARKRKDATVYLFEKSGEALYYLRKNADGVSNATVIEADVFSFDFSELRKPVLIVSNPPYIESAEIPTLQKEVLSEPRMALDGGVDGLDFYRLFALRLLSLIEKNGFIAVECGENQAERIISIFSPHLKNTYAEKDFNGVERFIIGEK